MANTQFDLNGRPMKIWEKVVATVLVKFFVSGLLLLTGMTLAFKYYALLGIITAVLALMLGIALVWFIWIRCPTVKEDNK